MAICRPQTQWSPHALHLPLTVPFATTCSYQKDQQLTSLQQQLQALSQQRDDAVLNLSTTQEDLEQTRHELDNLQLVLEQFQKGMYIHSYKTHFTHFTHTELNFITECLTCIKICPVRKTPRSKAAGVHARPPCVVQLQGCLLLCLDYETTLTVQRGCI